jgi:hypothetical protein
LIRAASRPSLPNVTLVAVTSVALQATIDAVHASMAEVDFGEILLLSDQPLPRRADPRISWRRIDRLGSTADYSGFMLRSLADHISTDHALCVQWDGFVLNGEAWDPSFLDYDYIGAVWPHFDDGHNVGNGGFSLRSRRLLEASRHLPFDGTQAEDVVISRLARSQLEADGFRFAPPSVAHRFAYERTPPTGREFGFHGAFNLVRNLPGNKALELFRALEPHLLARSERLELLRWALAHGRLRLGMNMLARLI